MPSIACIYFIDRNRSSVDYKILIILRLLKKMSLGSIIMPNTIHLVKYRHVQTLFVLYLISNLLLVLNINGIYWDDWVLYHHSFDDIKIMTSQLTGDTHLFEFLFGGLNHIGNGVFSYRLTTFFIYFLSGLFLYFILLDIKSMSRNTAFYITLLFLILPINSARICLCVTQYGICLCLFFMSFWLLTRYMNKQGSFFFRLLILSLFYLSFMVSSLLVFYLIVLLYIIYKSPGRSLKSVLMKHIDFLCLPILFFYIKTHYFVPYGLYEHYNAISSDYGTMVIDFLMSFKTAFYKPLSQAMVVALRFLFLSITAMSCLFFYLRKKLTINNEQELTSIGFMTGLGLLFFGLAIFPYVAVGKKPELLYFNSRHMLLIPLGMSLCLYSCILFIKRKYPVIAHSILIALLASCIIKNLHDQSQYLKDWFYQVAMEEHYKSNPLIKDHSTFLFKTNISFANQQSMQFYQHNGRLRKIFGNDLRFMGDNINEINTYANYKPYQHYNFSSWNRSDPVMITIQKDPEHDITIKPFLKLLLGMLTDEIAFRREAKKLINMSVG